MTAPGPDGATRREGAPGIRPPTLLVEDLRKSYGAVPAVDGISFQVAPGEIVGLLGPNGAGKTTTINMILGVLSPTSGAIRIDGLELAPPPLRGAAAHELRSGLRAASRQPDGLGEPPRIRPPVRRAERRRARRGAARRI